MNDQPFCNARVDPRTGPTRFYGYACCGREGHSERHFITEAGNVAFEWDAPVVPSGLTEGTFMVHDNSPNFVPPALVELAARGYQRINVNAPWNDGTTRPNPIGPAELRACWCFECLDAPEHGFNNPTMQRMILCPACGNKRCPRATDHRLACTGSNDEGQWGSRYGERVSTSALSTPEKP